MLCQLEEVPAAGGMPAGRFVAAYADDELFGLVLPGRPGVLVAPRAHVSLLPAQPARAAAILATLRLVLEDVKEAYGVGEAEITPLTDLPGAAGHLCYGLAPVGLVEGAETPADPALLASRLANTLKQRTTPR